MGRRASGKGHERGAPGDFYRVPRDGDELFWVDESPCVSVICVAARLHSIYQRSGQRCCHITSMGLPDTYSTGSPCPCALQARGQLTILFVSQDAIQATIWLPLGAPVTSNE